MLIGELVKKSGLTKDTIRFYERKGLINLSKKQRRENNYKEYPDQVLNRLLLIIKIKEMGFTLNEIDAFLELWQNEDANCKNLKYTLEDKLTLIDNQISKLTQLRQRVSTSLTHCNNNDCEFEKTIPSCLCQ
jgi:MerR family copper efflux transcriptional regulator